MNASIDDTNILQTMEDDVNLFPPMTHLDRCDSCVAQAQAQVFVIAGMDNLKFCAHHFKENEAMFVLRNYLFSAPKGL
jgi:hypothetical protein